MTQPSPSTPRLSDTAPPLHEVVRERITENILTGVWAAGTVLPNEVALAQEFGVAIGTLRRALRDLTDEGMLSRRRKTGTVVTGRAPRLSLRFLFRYFRLHDEMGQLVEAEAEPLSLCEGLASAAEAEALHLPAGARLTEFRRLRKVGGKVVMLDRFLWQARRFSDLPEGAEGMPALLYLHLQSRHGLIIAAVRERVTATSADVEVANLLGLDPGAPVLRIEEIAYDAANVPVILASHMADTSRFAYLNELR